MPKALAALLLMFTAAAAAATALVSFTPQGSAALDSITSSPFGGRTFFVFPCTCSVPPGWLLFVGPPTPTVAYFKPGVSVAYQYYAVKTVGPWVLGTQGTGGMCKFYVVVGCAAIPYKGVIQKIGTSPAVSL